HRAAGRAVDARRSAGGGSGMTPASPPVIGDPGSARTGPVMGPLLYHERGRGHLSIGEPITRCRWPRKTFRITDDLAVADAALGLNVLHSLWNPVRLDVLLQVHRLGSLDPGACPADDWTWRAIQVPASALRLGEIAVTLRSDASA